MRARILPGLRSTLLLLTDRLKGTSSTYFWIPFQTVSTVIFDLELTRPQSSNIRLVCCNSFSCQQGSSNTRLFGCNSYFWPARGALTTGYSAAIPIFGQLGSPNGRLFCCNSFLDCWGSSKTRLFFCTFSLVTARLKAHLQHTPEYITKLSQQSTLTHKCNISYHSPGHACHGRYIICLNIDSKISHSC